MSGPTRVEISVRPNGTGTLRINGVDYSSAVAGFRLDAGAGRGTSLTLELVEVDIELQGIDVRVDAEGPVDTRRLCDPPPPE